MRRVARLLSPKRERPGSVWRVPAPDEKQTHPPLPARSECTNWSTPFAAAQIGRLLRERAVRGGPIARWARDIAGPPPGSSLEGCRPGPCRPPVGVHADQRLPLPGAAFALRAMTELRSLATRPEIERQVRERFTRQIRRAPSAAGHRGLYLMIVKLRETGAERMPAELVAAMTSV